MSLTINQVRNVKWGNYAQTEYDLEVQFVELGNEWVPFRAADGDVEAHGQALFNGCQNGDYGAIGDFTPDPVVTGEEAMTILREARNIELEATDWAERPTYWDSLTTEKQAEWTTYRNGLRNLPADNPNAEWGWNADYTAREWKNCTWPTKPE
jgi:hypothetical protein